jgi:hypothetical protein
LIAKGLIAEKVKVLAGSCDYKQAKNYYGLQDPRFDIQQPVGCAAQITSIVI